MTGPRSLLGGGYPSPRWGYPKMGYLQTGDTSLARSRWGDTPAHGTTHSHGYSTNLSDNVLLPPAYVVRREGNSFTLLVCSHLGGYPYPIMLCNISQNAMGQPGGYPARSSQGGTLAGGYPGRGGTLARGVPWWGVPWQGVPWSGTPTPQPGQDGGYPDRGGTQVGQQKEYSLHGGRYASCVQAGGLSCYYYSPTRTLPNLSKGPTTPLCKDFSQQNGATKILSLRIASWLSMVKSTDVNELLHICFL